MKKIFLLFILVLFTITAFSVQRERIISYHSDIRINQDASMIVTETIKVYAAGYEIRRGIYRDFPTKYKDHFGNNVTVDFDILDVQRDGFSEEYHTENQVNGIRLYIGNENRYLNPGEYTYTITYRTNRQLGFFPDHDELYWNVTGNGWIFDIEKASALITLPENIPSSSLKCFGYTGPEGSRAQNLSCSVSSNGKAKYETRKTLRGGEGLTIVLEFPKGIVEEPTAEMKFQYFLDDNKSEVIGSISLLAILIYYLFVWFRVGKDPEKNTIIPLFNPPDNLSPAAIRFINRMAYDNKVFAASILNMAVKGYLRIKEIDGEFTLIKHKADKSVLSKEEKKIADNLVFSKSDTGEVSVKEVMERMQKISSSNNFLVKKMSGLITSALQSKYRSLKNEADSNEDQLKLTQSNHVIFRNTISELKKDLKNTYEKEYFFTNRKYFVIGLIVSFLLFCISFVFGSFERIGIMIWLTMWSVGVGFLVTTAFKGWKEVFSGGKIKFTVLGGTIFMTIFSIPFILGELFGLYIFYTFSSLLAVFLLGAVIFINLLFFHLLKAPTLLGRKVLDKIEGFKIYLSTAEKNRLGYTVPVETPEVFEKYLPYALALNVEQEWAEKFSNVLLKAGTEQNYSPMWYTGTNWNNFNTSSFVSSFSSSFSSAISSSSTSPGSSSGSSGSSGGGGGGGGGGGW